MKKEKILSIGSFRSNTTTGELSKTYVIVFTTGIVLIIRRILTTKEEKLYTTIKQFKNYFLIQEEMKFKIDSLNTISEIVNNTKSYLLESDIIL